MQRVEADGVASLQTRRALAQAFGIQASALGVYADARRRSAATTPSTVYLKSTSALAEYSVRYCLSEYCYSFVGHTRL